MPTLENIQHLEQLLNAAVALVDTRKVVERVEQDIRITKERLAAKEGRLDGSGDVEGEKKEAENEDADGSGDDDAEGDEDADGETDRAVSIAASAISRKEVSLSFMHYPSFADTDHVVSPAQAVSLSVINGFKYDDGNTGTKPEAAEIMIKPYT